MDQVVYLDNHTVCKPFYSSVEKMIPFYKERWGSLHAPHRMGAELIAPLKSYFMTIRNLMGMEEGDGLVFTPGASDGLADLLLSTFLHVSRENGRSHFLTSAVESMATLNAFQNLEALDCFYKILPVNSKGQLTEEILQQHLGPRTALLSVSWADSLTGVVHPILDLANYCKAKEVLLHVDASSIIGKLFFQFRDFNIDFMTVDSSSVHAPQGAGLLLVKSGSPFSSLNPLQNFNLPAIAAMSASLERVVEYFDHICTETARLRDRLEEGIRQGFPDAVVFFEQAERLPNCSAIAFPGIASDALLYLLNRKGIYATNGDGKFQKLSTVLQACGVDPALSCCSISFSLSWETKEEEIDYAIEVIVDCAQHLRSVSANILQGEQ